MTLQEQLAEPFSRNVEKTLQKGNARLTYIPVSEILTRLNDVFGIAGWGYVINSCKRDSTDTDFVIAHVSLHIYSEMGIQATIDGIGGQKINRTRNGDIIELGDDMKGAVSDALKKAAQALGVGLYLARSEEPAREHKAPQRNEDDSLITDAQFKTLDNLVKQLYGKETTVEQLATKMLNREVTNSKQLTRTEASDLIGQAIKARKETKQ